MAPPNSKTLLLSAQNLTKQYGQRPVFEELSFHLFEGDRVGVIGPNGSGKSTLLRILAGLEEPDSGTRAPRKGCRVGYVPQDPELDPAASCQAVVEDALLGLPIEDFERHDRARRQLGRMGFEDPERRVGELSGGWKKRLAIALELAREPDVLLLDEPTNHLDLEGVLELEKILLAEPRAFVVVSHDRRFLENIARRMIEIDRVYPDGLLEVAGRYSDLLERRDEVRRNQLEYQETLANRARREVEWLRRGPKARTSKSSARIDAAHELLDELAEVRGRTREASTALDFEGSGRRTKQLLVARGLTKSYGKRTVLNGIDLVLTPGLRLGLLGANGSGKTTLLSLLAGTLEPDAGTIDRAPALQTVLFDQARETLDLTVSLRRALAPESDSVVYQDRAVHVASWARRFLFRNEQLDTPVAKLSGGERARILLARAMLRPADVLILDEPTNDLDIPTLEVLEESLLEFSGALLLVTHDRYLLDRVSNVILALDGQGGAETFADLGQWEEQQARPVTSEKVASPAPARVKAPSAKRLSYLEQREWEGMEAAVLAAEEALGTAEARLADPAIATDAGELQRRSGELAAAQAEVERLYARWAELEAKRG
ncbi:MAG: ABC-F family ATP-binding cassette domain-containing protein [Thermoanaerobaculia bacterium]|nr:ABC-F family ATP-binding cassette domain-containing protein [Thermoanaerobaculia bacterium]